MRKRIYILLISVVIVIGCARTDIIDKILIVTVFGFDIGENGELIGTALIPDYQQSKADNKIYLLEERANAPFLIIPKMSEHTSSPVKISKIRVVVIGREFAEKGITEVVERLMMTPKLATNIQLAVAEQSANKLMKAFKEEKSLMLFERLRHNMEEKNLPDNNLHYFLNYFFGEGMDAFAPMLSLDKKENVHISGLAIFKDDKLKTTLNRYQTLIFTLLKDKHMNSILQISPNTESDVENIIITEIFKTKKKWKWYPEEERVVLDLKIQLFLTQFPNTYDPRDIKDIKEIKKYISGKFTKDVEDLLTLFKENEVDPLGIGNICRSQDRNWNEKDFYDIYPHLPIEVNLDLEILHSGLEG